jgi:pimeloyl-ACP methyl ester carboxylesterase
MNSKRDRHKPDTLWRKLALVIFAIGAFIMLTALQRHLIYFPNTAQAQALEKMAARSGLQPWRDSAGKTIGWRTPEGPGARYRMLVFHGNAGYALDRVYFVNGLRQLVDQWDVFLFEYPGYGAREGAPSEDSFKATATQALEVLLADDSSPVFIAGESLGSGVASYLASTFQDQVAGLLLVTPFSSLTDVAAHHYPFLPVRMLLSERYNSTEALVRYRGPVAFLLAGRDEVVPRELGQQLYDSYSGPKWLYIEEHAGHNTLNYSPGAPWWGEVASFLTSPQGG